MRGPRGGLGNNASLEIFNSLIQGIVQALAAFCCPSAAKSASGVFGKALKVKASPFGEELKAFKVELGAQFSDARCNGLFRGGCHIVMWFECVRVGCGPRGMG